jgi:hypothetical protein
LGIVDKERQVPLAGFGRKKDKKGFFEWYFNSRTPKERPMARTTPMRIEPKTFFANERTFLSWLHMAVTIGSIAAALLGFAGLADSTRKPRPQVLTWAAQSPTVQGSLVCMHLAVCLGLESEEVLLGCSQALLSGPATCLKSNHRRIVGTGRLLHHFL